jgi:hypothetical protein
MKMHNPGSFLTASGPAPFNGDILNTPDVVWTEDHWDDKRVQDALSRLKEQGDSQMTAFWREKYRRLAGTYWLVKNIKNYPFWLRKALYLLYSNAFAGMNSIRGTQTTFTKIDIIFTLCFQS